MKDKFLNGKVALITGASRGIGRGIAIELAKIGACVIVNYRKDLKGAEETKKTIEERGGYCRIIKCDVSSYEDTKLMIEKIIRDFGKIDILINNAGISKVVLFIDMEEEDWDNIINTNLKGVFNCSRNVLPYMIGEKNGVIINISSMWGSVGASCEVIYSASKGGVDSFTKALAKEVGPSNIRVNAISPGVINTSMNEWMSCEEKDSLKDEIPLCRFGECEDIGKAVVFLCSDNAKYITGQILTIDGGMI
ncbi:SDR family oxidoreductase [Clostridium tetani]|nr:SDR family oxidoreductase [Clostridium tetani]QBD86805.1 SDR family oxidoreductase [Clostridium tetani]